MLRGPSRLATLAGSRVKAAAAFIFYRKRDDAVMQGSSSLDAAVRGPLHSCRCIDCGFVLSETAVSWPTCRPLQRELLKTPESSRGSAGARNKQAFTLNGGSGTHIDAPAHFVPGGRTVEQLTAAELAGVPLAVVDVTAKARAHAQALGSDGGGTAAGDWVVDASDVLSDEVAHGAIPHGALVCVRTGWSEERYSSLDAYCNWGDQRDDDVDAHTGLPRMHFPGLTVAAAKLLVEGRGAVGIGVDTLSPDGGSSCGAAGADATGGQPSFGVHHEVLGADRYILWVHQTA